MEQYTRTQLHPLLAIAAVAVIVTCLLAIGVMVGLVPSPFLKGRASASATGQPPLANKAMSDYSLAPRTPAPSSRQSATSPRPPVGSTQSTMPSQTVAGGSTTAPPICATCGTVTGVRTIRKQGDASMLGPAAGGLVGGLLGHQIGSGRGNTIATVLGAGAGAAAGTEIERRSKSTTHYVVDVRMEDGSIRHFTYGSAPGVEAGSKVRVVGGKLVHA